MDHIDEEAGQAAALAEQDARFAPVRDLLGGGREVSTAGQLAAVTTALPAETPVHIDTALLSEHGVEPAEGWVPRIAARSDFEVRGDEAVPAVELSVCLVPGAGAPLPEKTWPVDPYERALHQLAEANLRGFFAAARQVLEGLAGDLGEASGYLRSGGDVHAEVLQESEALRAVAGRLATLAGRAVADAESED
ncbi:hypothetical protein NE236_42005 [Actinoallomurus purpureus]|uniref:hypothetical protein n=1 Tax=Actinoallomurus purpureus TaxID=478114 RepID=UPI0020926082|nr:hypothetical protein [Actinoallomurus purpureus]MCO6011546.1 hypothetical protein [Actinoallomurus purpureus]